MSALGIRDCESYLPEPLEGWLLPEFPKGFAVSFWSFLGDVSHPQLCLEGITMPWVPDLRELREEIIVFVDSEGKWWKVGFSIILFDDEAAGLEGGGGGSRGRGVGEGCWPCRPSRLSNGGFPNWFCN